MAFFIPFVLPHICIPIIFLDIVYVFFRVKIYNFVVLVSYHTLIKGIKDKNNVVTISANTAVTTGT